MKANVFYFNVISIMLNNRTKTPKNCSETGDCKKETKLLSKK